MIEIVTTLHGGGEGRIPKGFQLVTVSSDARLMAAGAQQVVATMRQRPAPGSAQGY